MSSVLVVVIVGVIIVAITASAVSGGPKPATRPEPAHRAAHRRRGRRPEPSPVVEAAIDWGMPEPEPPDPEPEPELPDPEPEPAPLPFSRRSAHGSVDEASREPAFEGWVPPPAPAVREDVATAPLDLLEPDDADLDPVLERRTLLGRLRAAVLLVLTVVLLGALAAAVLGATILVGARAIDRALG